MALKAFGPAMAIPAQQYIGKWQGPTAIGGDASRQFAGQVIGLVVQSGSTLQPDEGLLVVRLVETLLNGDLIQRGSPAAAVDVAGGAICYLNRMRALGMELSAHNIYQAIFVSLYLAEKTLYGEPASSIAAWQHAITQARAMPAPVLQAVDHCVPLTVQWLNGKTQLDAQMTLMGSLLVDSFNLDDPGTGALGGLEASAPVERVASIQPQLGPGEPRVLAEGAVRLPLRIGPSSASGARALDGRIAAQPRLTATIPQRVQIAPPGFAEAFGRERPGVSISGPSDSGSGKVASQGLPGQVPTDGPGAAPAKLSRRIPGYGHSPSMTVSQTPGQHALGKRAQRSAPPLRQANRPGAVGSAEASQRVLAPAAAPDRTASISVNRGSVVAPAPQVGATVRSAAAQQPAAAAVRVQAPGAVSRFITAIQARWTRWRNS